ncbi:MAG: demethoxyubiquinone hydroxylase family protein [Robiginitomaculum sp.]|nr:MAG: demethoxyubiquinone hydroxylase family protein [Robiginitomaculum sp.]
MRKRAASSVNECMIKVDHAGENGAVNIYRAQKLMAYWRAPQLVANLKETQSHEERHRRIFKTYLDKRNIHPCMSYHLCGFGGFVLGFVTGIIGPKAIAATTYAVESVVLEHLQTQVDYLKRHDQDALAAVTDIIAEEQEHHDHAEHALQQPNLFSKILIRIVRFCTECVIHFGMRTTVRS